MWRDQVIGNWSKCPLIIFLNCPEMRETFRSPMKHIFEVAMPYLRHIYVISIIPLSSSITIFIFSGKVIYCWIRRIFYQPQNSFTPCVIFISIPVKHPIHCMEFWGNSPDDHSDTITAMKQISSLSQRIRADFKHFFLL